MNENKPRPKLTEAQQRIQTNLLAEAFGYLTSRARQYSPTVCEHLLAKVEDILTDVEEVPNNTWWRRSFEISGHHMILTEEGWEPGEGRATYEEEAKLEGIPLEEMILDEINAPATPAQP